MIRRCPRSFYLFAAFCSVQAMWFSTMSSMCSGLAWPGPSICDTRFCVAETSHLACIIHILTHGMHHTHTDPLPMWWKAIEYCFRNHGNRLHAPTMEFNCIHRMACIGVHIQHVQSPHTARTESTYSTYRVHIQHVQSPHTESLM